MGGIGTKVNANGHRRRQVRQRVLSEETRCALCDQHVNQSIPWPHDDCAVVDEDIPRSKGGSQYHRSNCRLMHNRCNRWKGTLTLAQARVKLAGAVVAAPREVEASPIW